MQLTIGGRVRAHVGRLAGLPPAPLPVRRASGDPLRLSSRLSRCSAAQAEASTSDSPSPSASGAGLKAEARQSNEEVYDKLITVFQAKDRSEWRKLITFSKQWPALADGVLARILELREAEPDAEKKLEARKFWRSLKNVHTELQRYGAIVAKVRATPEVEWSSVVAGHRHELTDSFFDYIGDLVAASHEDRSEQEFLVESFTRIGALAEAFDKAAEDAEAMDSAAETLNELLQVDSLEAADQMIDSLADQGRLDPALLLTMAKAYSGVKESPYTQEEVKDVMYHMYMRAKEAAAAEQPTEVRILKALLAVTDEGEWRHELAQAFVAGEDFETADLAYMCTTPPALLGTVEAVLATYEGQRGKNTMVGDAAGLMNPQVIQKLKSIRDEIKKRHM